MGATSKVACSSTKGPLEIQVHPEWSPHGAKRFLDLVESEYFTDVPLFRVNRWIVQFGAKQQPTTKEIDQAAKPWFRLIPKGRHHLPTIPDDPFTDCQGKCTKGSLFDGALSYAGGGKNSRAGQIFIVHHRGKSQPLGESPWEVPFANLTKGLHVVKKWYSEYGDDGINQIDIFSKGEEWVRQKYPHLDWMNWCRLVEEKKMVIETPLDLTTAREQGQDPFPQVEAARLFMFVFFTFLFCCWCLFVRSFGRHATIFKSQ